MIICSAREMDWNLPPDQGYVSGLACHYFTVLQNPCVGGRREGGGNEKTDAEPDLPESDGGDQADSGERI